MHCADPGLVSVSNADGAVLLHTVGVALYLDMCHPSRPANPALQATAWRTLASALTAAAAPALHLASPAETHAPGPNTTAGAEAGGVAAADGVLQHGEGAQQQADGTEPNHDTVHRAAALRDWARLRGTLEDRQGFWGAYHFDVRQLPATLEHWSPVDPLLQSDAEVLHSKAAVAAFVLGAANGFTAAVAARAAAAVEQARSMPEGDLSGTVELAVAVEAARQLHQAWASLDQLLQREAQAYMPQGDAAAAALRGEDAMDVDEVAALGSVPVTLRSRESEGFGMTMSSSASNAVHARKAHAAGAAGSRGGVGVQGHAGGTSGRGAEGLAAAAEAGEGVYDEDGGEEEEVWVPPHLLPMPDQWWRTFPQCRRGNMTGLQT